MSDSTGDSVSTNSSLGVLVEKYLSRDPSERSIRERNEIIQSASPLIRYVTISTRYMYQKFCEAEDIANEAVIALISAIERFDPSKGAKFETYATIKMRGAIIDYVRNQDFVPRSVRRFSKDMDRAFGKLYVDLDREPTTAEIAEAMQMSLERFNRFLSATAAAHSLSFEEMMYDAEDSGSGKGTVDIADGDALLAVEESLTLKERSSILAGAIEGLKEQQRLVVTLYYYEKLHFSEIAQVLEVSESRVSQIHSKAMMSLKHTLTEYEQGESADKKAENVPLVKGFKKVKK